MSLSTELIHIPKVRSQLQASICAIVQQAAKQQSDAEIVECFADIVTDRQTVFRARSEEYDKLCDARSQMMRQVNESYDLAKESESETIQKAAQEKSNTLWRQIARLDERMGQIGPQIYELAKEIAIFEGLISHIHGM